MSENKSNTPRWNIRGIFESIDSFGWFILLAATPFFLMIQPEYSWILLLLPLTWLISVLAKRQPVPSTPMNLALLVISIQVLISLYATYDIAVSLQKVTGVIWGMAVFFALVRFGNKRIGILISTFIFILGSAGISVLGLFGIEWPTNKIIFFNSVYEQFPKFSSIIPGLSEGFHPNEVGGALTWIIPFWMVVLGWLIIRFKKIRKHTSPILIILYILVPLMLIMIAAGALFIDPYVTAINFVTVAFFAVILATFWKLSIEADGKEVHFHYGPFGKRLEIDEIATIRPVAVHPLKDYMGWGIRMGPDGSIGYISSGRTGVRIETRRGKIYVVTCNRPQELVDLVRSARRRGR